MDQIDNDDYSNQLRSLRLLLGTRFRQVSTATLAGMVCLPSVAIRGIESGRRTLNNEDRKAIDLRLGARWNSELQQWGCTWDPTEPFNRGAYEFYRNELKQGRALAKANRKLLLASLDYLLAKLSVDDANITLLGLADQLVICAEVTGLPKQDVEYLEENRRRCLNGLGLKEDRAASPALNPYVLEGSETPKRGKKR